MRDASAWGGLLQAAPADGLRLRTMPEAAVAAWSERNEGQGLSRRLRMPGDRGLKVDVGRSWAAATILQAAMRGHLARQQLPCLRTIRDGARGAVGVKVFTLYTGAQRSLTLHETYGSTDMHTTTELGVQATAHGLLQRAAAKIQSVMRGIWARRTVDGFREWATVLHGALVIQKSWRRYFYEPQGWRPVWPHNESYKPFHRVAQYEPSHRVRSPMRARACRVVWADAHARGGVLRRGLPRRCAGV